MNLTAGTTLQGGKYLLSHPLEAGDRSLTFKATQVGPNRPVIVKMLQASTNADPFVQSNQPFIQQVGQLAQCNHPGLAGVLDYFEESNLPFVVLDDVVGRSLAERVQSHGVLSEAEAIRYIRQAASALSLLHRQNILHQNVKPQNLMQPSGAEFVVLVNVAITPPVLSSPSEYAAIEQIQPQVSLTAATDVYALAASLYFLVTGTAPIAAAWRGHQALIPPRQRQPQLSPAIEAAILAGMAVNPQARPSTVATWIALLPEVTPKSPVPPPVNGSKPPAALPPAVLPPAALSQRLPATPPPLLVTPQLTAPTAPIAPAAPHTNGLQLHQTLLTVAGIAGTIGAGLGLALRLSGATGVGSSFLHPQQAFPPAKDFPEVSAPASPPSSAPTLPEVPASDASVAEPPPIRTAPPVERVSPSEASIEPAPALTAPKPAPKPTAESSPALPAPAPGILVPTAPESPAPVAEPVPSIAPEPAPSIAPAPIPATNLPTKR